MTPNVEILQVAETRATEQLVEHLRAHLTLTTDAFNLVGVLITQIPEAPMSALPKSLHVTVKLLLRFMNDLRCVEVLAAKGYPIQACTLAASMCETAFTVAWLGENEERAQEWLNHDDPARPFRDLRTIMREGLTGLDVPEVEARTSAEYRVYRQLCMAKHANPLLESRFGLTISGEMVSSMNGPDTSENGIRVAWFALEHAARYACAASASFFNNHLATRCSPEVAGALWTWIESVNTKRKPLEAAAIARWGNEDPFAGRW